MSSVAHLHSGARMLPAKEHKDLLSKQFLLERFRRNYSCSRLLEAESPPRNIKRSFHGYVDDIEQYTDQTSDGTNFRYALTAIHSGTINTFTNSLSVHGVRGLKPTPIADVVRVATRML